MYAACESAAATFARKAGLVIFFKNETIAWSPTSSASDESQNSRVARFTPRSIKLNATDISAPKFGGPGVAIAALMDFPSSLMAEPAYPTDLSLSERAVAVRHQLTRRTTRFESETIMRTSEHPRSTRSSTGGDEIPPGTFHGGDEIPPGTFHA